MINSVQFSLSFYVCLFVWFISKTLTIIGNIDRFITIRTHISEDLILILNFIQVNTIFMSKYTFDSYEHTSGSNNFWTTENYLKYKNEERVINYICDHKILLVHILFLLLLHLYFVIFLKRFIDFHMLIERVYSTTHI